MIVKIIQDVGNKLEVKADKLQETLSKEIQDLRIKQVEMRKTLTEMKKKSLETTTAEHRRQKTSK